LVRILGTDDITVKLLDKQDTVFLVHKKREIENLISKICEEYSAFALIWILTYQMQSSITCTNPEFADYFTATWRGKEKNKEVIEKNVNKMMEIGIRKYEEEAMNETYRQMVLSGVDLQRALRSLLYKYCATASGETNLFPESVSLQLFECLYSIYCLDWIEGMINETGIPIYIIENKLMTIFIPLMSKSDSLPFQKGLDNRANRLFYQQVTSRGTDETKIPQWQCFIKTLSLFEQKSLVFLTWLLYENTTTPFVIFGDKHANDLFNHENEFPKEVVFEWINGPKSPFVKIKFENETCYLATRMIVEDKLFRIMWESHQGDHIRLRGGKFEEFVLDMLQKQFPESFSYKNKYFFIKNNGETNRYEIDRTFVVDGLFFLIECKNLLLIEDTANFRRLRARDQELRGYGEYLELKATLLKDNFTQLEESIPGLKDQKCTQIIPLVMSIYPDMLTFHKVPFITIYEFIRYINLLKEKHKFIETFEDIASTEAFNFVSFRISRS
jgi:hypothetical protein